MNKSHLIGALGAVMCTFITLSSQAALIGVLPASPPIGTDWQAVYDDDRNITWIVDANLAASNAFGVAGINANGTMNWNTANS